MQSPTEAEKVKPSDTGVKRLRIFESIQALGEKELGKERTPS